MIHEVRQEMEVHSKAMETFFIGHSSSVKDAGAAADASAAKPASAKTPTMRDALLQFMNHPHPLTMLADYNSYGPNGSISRYHNPANYTTALLGVAELISPPRGCRTSSS